MCEFEAKWFGARYIDGACSDGYLWDMDGDGPEGDKSHPCPRCNTEEFLLGKMGDALCYGTNNFIPWCGAIVWENAVERAMREDPKITEHFLSKLGQVHTFDWSDRKAVHENRAPYKAVITTIFDYTGIIQK